jgi:hypothetical protein
MPAARTTNPKPTPTQLAYLDFIRKYVELHKRAPAEHEMQAFFGTTPPSVHQMVVTLERKGFIEREHGKARSIRLVEGRGDRPSRDKAPPPRPRWLRLGDILLGEVWPIADRELVRRKHPIAVGGLSLLALYHLNGCLSASMSANEQGRHSVAVCLLRHCVEALSVIEVGLQETAFAGPLLREWDEGRVSQGQLRARLEKTTWPRYGSGLWDEPWPEFYANLARAVQPYAHYTPELSGWQMAIEPGASHHADGRMLVLMRVGPTAYEPVKASRLTLMHVLVVWTLARLLVFTGGKETDVGVKRLDDVSKEVGPALAKSKLLFRRKDWAEELAPFVMFRPGASWLDD